MIYSATFTEKLIKELNKKRSYTFIQTLADSDHQLTVKVTTDLSSLSGLDSIIRPETSVNEAIINLENIKKFKVVVKSEEQSYFNAKIGALGRVLKELNYQRCLVFVEKKTLLQ